MVKFKFLSKNRISHLPKCPGVYIFKNKSVILYIGKAGNIKSRVKNHFQSASTKALARQTGTKDSLFVHKIEWVGYIKTDSEIEALLLEAELIKKYQPKYNIFWRDDKNYFYIGISNSIKITLLNKKTVFLPRVFITHQPIRQAQGKPQLKTTYIGPFVDGSSLKQTLKYLRRVFVYYTAIKHSQSLCPWCHLKLCPGPNPDKKEYQKNVKNLTAILKGEKRAVLKNLKREMFRFAQKKWFERAAKTRNQINALEKVLAHAKILRVETYSNYSWEKTAAQLKVLLGVSKIKRIESYDISNIQGKEATGSMVVFKNGLPEKNAYRHFRIRMASTPNDIGMIQEILKRRFRHEEWPYPEAILVDGGKAQLNAAVGVKNSEPRTEKIRTMALAKKHNELFLENKKEAILLNGLSRETFNLILQLRDEAHRFAIKYHHKLRKNGLLGKNPRWTVEPFNY